MIPDAACALATAARGRPDAVALFPPFQGRAPKGALGRLSMGAFATHGRLEPLWVHNYGSNNMALFMALLEGPKGP